MESIPALPMRLRVPAFSTRGSIGCVYWRSDYASLRPLARRWCDARAMCRARSFGERGPVLRSRVQDVCLRTTCVS
ncbi:unnamed protein product [Lasius platythorax]|uniref:Uncharacterized protein n=1 Tax=Lasius platythorax TaxID=488582 RepID=A0AAV2N036_9HYME